MNLEYGCSRRVIFGPEELNRLGSLAAEYGKRALLLTGSSSLRSSGTLPRIEELLRSAGVAVESASIEGEPTVCSIDDELRNARPLSPQVIIAIGGGSVLDAGKAIGTLLTNTENARDSVLDFLEGVGRDRKVGKPSIPVIAVPTTAGTGSEVTRNSVIRSDDYTFKKSMRSHFMRPEVALVDPVLTMSAPAWITAACGADAETQLIEAYVSRRASVFTDGIAREGLRLVTWALEHAMLNPEDDEAREAMAMASLLGGIALDNAGLGAVHGLASPLGGRFDIHHGVICANLLPEITEGNIRLARSLADSDELARRTLDRYREIAEITGAGNRVEDLVEFLTFQRSLMDIPRFNALGVHEDDIPEIIANCRGGSMKTNPVELPDEAIAGVLETLIR